MVAPRKGARTPYGCVPVPVRISGDPRLGPTAIDLDAARDSARSQGMEVGMVLVTNPHNPLGIVYEHGEVLSRLFMDRRIVRSDDDDD